MLKLNALDGTSGAGVMIVGKGGGISFRTSGLSYWKTGMIAGSGAVLTIGNEEVLRAGGRAEVLRAEGNEEVLYACFGTGIGIGGVGIAAVFAAVW